MFSLLGLFGFLFTNLVSFGNIGNYFSLNNNSITFNINIIQNSNGNYIVSKFANNLGKNQRNISSLGIIANCDGNYTKTDIENEILNNSGTILSGFNSGNNKVEIDNCDYYNIKNPGYKKQINNIILNNFSGSKLDNNGNFTGTNIKDITTRGFLKGNSINITIKNGNKILIVSSEKYLYGSDKNILKLVYKIQNIKYDNIKNKQDYFYYTNTYYKFNNLKDDGQFTNLTKKNIIYLNSKYYLQNKQENTNYYSFQYKDIFLKKQDYGIYTNNTGNNYLFNNGNQIKFAEKNMKTNIDDILYIISNNNFGNYDNITDFNPDYIENYLKKVFNFNNIYYKYSIITGKRYFKLYKNGNSYIIEVIGGNGSYDLYNCINSYKTNNIGIFDYSYNITNAIVNNKVGNFINYEENNFAVNCLKKHLIETLYITEIDINKIKTTKQKNIENNNFYTNKINNLDLFLKNTPYYIAKNIIIKTPGTNNNLLYVLHKQLNKKPYVVYLYKSNNTINNIIYNPEYQISNFNIDGDSQYSLLYNKDNKEYYKIISHIDNISGNILKFKIQKANNIDYSLSYSGFINNIQDNNGILNVLYNPKNINNNGEIIITFKKNGNVLDIYKIQITKKQYKNNIVSINTGNVGFLSNNGKLYQDLTTTTKQNIFEIGNLANQNLICKTINTSIIFSSSNILDNFYIYNNKVIGNSYNINVNNIYGSIKKENNDILLYTNINSNINLKDYTDNLNRFYIESNKIKNENNLQIKLNISCINYKNEERIIFKNKIYNLQINSDNNNASVIFYNPILLNNTIIPLLSYSKNGNKTVIYKDNNKNDKINYDDVENRFKINYYYSGIKKEIGKGAINWLDDTYGQDNGNSNHIYNDIYNNGKYWKINNKYQFVKNDGIITKGIITTDNNILKNTKVYKTKEEILSPPVCSYITCIGNGICITHHRIGEKKRLYFINRNYNNNNYYGLFGGSLKTQNVDLSNIIKQNNIGKTYSNNKIFNFSLLVNVPSRIIKKNDNGKISNILTPFFYFRNITNANNLNIIYKPSSSLFKKITSNSYDNYKQNYKQKGFLFLNNKLKGFVKNARLRKIIIGPCLNDYNKGNYNIGNTNRCYVNYNKDTLQLTNKRYYNYNTNRYTQKDIFPNNIGKNIENINTLKGVFNLQYIIDVIITLKSPPYESGNNYNLSYLNNSANILLDNGGENLLSLDLPIQYIGQYSIIGNVLNNKLNNQKINDLLSFYNNISNNNFTKIVYGANVFKEYFTKILNGYQNSTVITKKYYGGYHCSHTYYENYIEDKNWNTNQIRTVKMNLGAWYYQGGYNSLKYPIYFNNLNKLNKFDNIENMIDKNIDYGSLKYNQQVGMMGNKIKLFGIGYTDNINKFANKTGENFGGLLQQEKLDNNYITNVYNNGSNIYKKQNIVDYLDKGKYFNKIIYINNNDDLNSLLFNGTDYNGDILSSGNGITKIYVNYNNVNIIGYNGNNNLKGNVVIYSKNTINILTNINKKQDNNFGVFLSKGNINIGNNVIYINGIYLITNNINTNFSSNPLIINGFVYNLGKGTFNCNRNITSLFLLNTNNKLYSDYTNINLNNIGNINFTSFWKQYTSYKTSGCLIKNNYNMKSKFLFKTIGNLGY